MPGQLGRDPGHLLAGRSSRFRPSSNRSQWPNTQQKKPRGASGRYGGDRARRSRAAAPARSSALHATGMAEVLKPGDETPPAPPPTVAADSTKKNLRKLNRPASNHPGSRAKMRFRDKRRKGLCGKACSKTSLASLSLRNYLRKLII
jgi:hypothetical protein